MKLIIGGAYQGKLTWAVEQFGLAPDTLCDLAQGFQPENAAITTLRRLRAQGERSRRIGSRRTQSSSRARSAPALCRWTRRSARGANGTARCSSSCPAGARPLSVFSAACRSS